MIHSLNKGFAVRNPNTFKICHNHIYRYRNHPFASTAICMPNKTYRTHSPKLRLLLVRIYHKSCWRQLSYCGLHVRAVSVFGKKSDAVCGFLAYFCAVLRFSDPPYASLHLLSTLSWERLSLRRKKQKSLMMYKTMKDWNQSLHQDI